jgi:hypothetical protein
MSQKLPGGYRKRPYRRASLDEGRLLLSFTIQQILANGRNFLSKVHIFLPIVILYFGCASPPSHVFIEEENDISTILGSDFRIKGKATFER